MDYEIESYLKELQQVLNEDNYGDKINAISNYIQDLLDEIESQEDTIEDLQFDARTPESPCEYCELKDTCEEIVEEEYRYFTQKYTDVQTIKDTLRHTLKYGEIG